MLSLPLPLGKYQDPDTDSREGITDQLGQLFGPFPDGRYFRVVQASGAITPYAKVLDYDDHDGSAPWDVAVAAASTNLVPAGVGQTELSGVTIPDNGIFLLQCGGKCKVTLDADAGAVAANDPLMTSNATAGAVEKATDADLHQVTQVLTAIEAMTVAATVYDAHFNHVIGY